MKSLTNLHAFPPSVAVMRLVIAFAAILLTICSQWLHFSAAPYAMDEWLRDRFVRLHAASTPETRIAVIDIDEASLTAAGPWPWPRQRIAELLENLLGPYGARGVALDLVLPEPGDEAGDTRLAMLAQHGPVVLAQAFDYVSRPQPLRVGQIAGGTSADATSSAPAATGFIANHAGLKQAQHLGNIGFVPDRDGTIRHLPMITRFDGRNYPALSLALFDCCMRASTSTHASDGFWRIPYNRDWSTYTVLPAAGILDGSVPTELVTGRLVVVGSSSLGLSDRVVTPLSASTSGMLVHASALTALLDEQAGQGVTRWPGRWTAVLFTVLVTLLASYAFPRFAAASNIAILCLASLAWLGLAYWIAPHDPAFSPGGPLTSHIFLLIVAVPFDWQIAQGKSRKLLGTLRQYVASAVVDELLRLGLKDPLTPRELDVTTLIADMEGYTTYVESLSMQEAATLTRDFLACLTRPVLAKQGTIDKYTGDGLVAFWGAPLPVENHADLALDAALEIVQEVRRFSEIRQQAGLPKLRVRIGIESGRAMAGDFGNASRSIYTAVGDSVNIAARLEQAARTQPFDIIVGQGTVSRSRRRRFLLLGEVVLRGKEKPTTLFTLETMASPEVAA